MKARHETEVALGSTRTTMALAHHLMLRLRDGRVLVRSVAERRQLARTVLASSAGESLLAFRAADSHLHVLVAGEAPPARGLAQRIESALKQRLRLPIGFAPVHVVPVVEQRHLAHAFWYVLQQEKHHEIEADPMHEASNLPDLLGLRLLGAESRRAVSAWLPRVADNDLRQLLRAMDHDGPANWSLLGDAAAAAVALPTVGGRSAEARLARAAALRVAAGQQTLAQMASALGVSEPTVWRARESAKRAPQALVDAVALQLRVRSAAQTEGRSLPAGR